MFPLTWLALGLIHPWLIIAAPFSAYVALRVFEVLGDAMRRARRLPAGRDVIRAKIIEVAEEIAQQ